MLSFCSDYSQGAHPEVLDALIQTNALHSPGYGTDDHCAAAAETIRRLIQKKDAAVHFAVGGTGCNAVLIAAALRPYECVVSPRTGHIYAHETGAVEATGHRVLTTPAVDGKLTPAALVAALSEHQNEHTALPRLVYLSLPTELGTLYCKEELSALSRLCRENGLYLYLDGARLGSALTSEKNDLTLPDLARLCDAFTIGGTKTGALFGEALVITNPAIDDHFRYMLKRSGGMLAKGRLLGVQFEALLAGDDPLYFCIGRHENRLAARLAAGLEEMGISFVCPSYTNQIFPLLPKKAAEALLSEVAFEIWGEEIGGLVPVRFVTGWGTTDEEVAQFLALVKKALS